MSATFSQLVTIATVQNFQFRVKLGMLTTAIAVYNEASTVTSHGIRAGFATKVLTNQSGAYDLFTVTLAVLTASGNIALNANPGTLPDYGILDADIETQLSAIWNGLAGV